MYYPPIRRWPWITIVACTYLICEGIREREILPETGAAAHGIAQSLMILIGWTWLTIRMLVFGIGWFRTAWKNRKNDRTKT